MALTSPHFNWHARLPLSAAAKLEAWREQHNMGKTEALLALALKAGLITEDDLVISRRIELPAFDAVPSQ